MTSLVILTKTFRSPTVAGTVTDEWSLEEAAEAWNLCERSSMKAYLYLVDLDADETILVEAFE